MIQPWSVFCSLQRHSTARTFLLEQVPYHEVEFNCASKRYQTRSRKWSEEKSTLVHRRLQPAECSVVQVYDDFQAEYFLSVDICTTTQPEHDMHCKWTCIYLASRIQWLPTMKQCFNNILTARTSASCSDPFHSIICAYEKQNMSPSFSSHKPGWLNFTLSVAPSQRIVQSFPTWNTLQSEGGSWTERVRVVVLLGPLRSVHYFFAGVIPNRAVNWYTGVEC